MLYKLSNEKSCIVLVFIMIFYRARVFIGNIARAIITRDDIIELFRPFGKIIAVNYFAVS